MTDAALMDAECIHGNVWYECKFCVNDMCLYDAMKEVLMEEETTHCVYPECGLPQTNNKWCNAHWMMFPHKCENSKCLNRLNYDDEPYCFTHSPDWGSSFVGYSAYRRSLGMPFWGG